MRDLQTLKSIIAKELVASPEQVSVVALVDALIEYGYAMRASDIHLEPEENGVRVRFRIDGILHDVFGEAKIQKILQPEVVSRIKVISELRTDEHLLPQDGRFKVQPGDIGEDVGEIDVRVSIMPTYYGENVIMRLLADTHTFELETLGFSEADLKRVLKAIAKPYGMILANGPTGSGKTTTLYTILKKLNDVGSSIITIEDPIEYSLSGTTQIQVNNQVGLTFANGLRSILRQDPNIVMVGEIRDEETASIAVNAALTGHLVLSTLHTNDAATTFPRLVDMGVPPFLVASTVNVTMGQRLVRTICSHCKKERTLSGAEAESLREILPNAKGRTLTFYKGEGCSECNGTGYEGRIGIREVLDMTEEVRRLVMERASAQDIKEAAVKSGMTTMLEDGLAKAQAGITTIEEVLRIIHE